MNTQLILQDLSLFMHQPTLRQVESNYHHVETWFGAEVGDFYTRHYYRIEPAQWSLIFTQLAKTIEILGQAIAKPLLRPLLWIRLAGAVIKLTQLLLKSFKGKNPEKNTPDLPF